MAAGTRGFQGGPERHKKDGYMFTSNPRHSLLSCILTFFRKPGQPAAVACRPQGGVDLGRRACTVHCVLFCTFTYRRHPPLDFALVDFPLMDGLALHPLSARKCPVSWWRPRDREQTIYVGRGWKVKRLSGAYRRLWVVVSGWQRSVQIPGEF